VVNMVGRDVRSSHQRDDVYCLGYPVRRSSHLVTAKVAIRKILVLEPDEHLLPSPSASRRLWVPTRSPPMPARAGGEAAVRARASRPSTGGLAPFPSTSPALDRDASRNVGRAAGRFQYKIRLLNPQLSPISTTNPPVVVMAPTPLATLRAA